MNKQNRNRLTRTENKETDSCQVGGSLEDCVKQMKSLRSTNWQLQNSHGGVKYSTGDTVNNNVTIYGARWVLDLLG